MLLSLKKFPNSKSEKQTGAELFKVPESAEGRHAVSGLPRHRWTFSQLFPKQPPHFSDEAEPPSVCPPDLSQARAVRSLKVRYA